MSESAAGSDFNPTPIVGTGVARFLNQYNPEYDRPYQRACENKPYLDPELTKVLEAERTGPGARQYNKRKDWMKSYMDECVKFQSITKSTKK